MRLTVLAQDEASNKTSMKGEELVEILKGEVDHKEKDVAQSGVISEQVGVLYIRESEAVRSEMMAKAIETDMYEDGPCSVRCSCGSSAQPYCLVQMLKQLLDRTHMAKHVKAPYPDIGMGYELVQANDGSGLLSGVE